jgi:hypothetical protein
VEDALELLAVTTRNSGLGRVFSDQCLVHLESSSGNGRVVKKIRSMMLYGAESWVLTARLENIMRCCDCRMLRYMA